MEINWVSVIIGIAAIAFGIYTFVLRGKSPEKLAKLVLMKNYWGEKKGHLIHLIGYTMVPIVFGLVILISGMFGL